MTEKFEENLFTIIKSKFFIIRYNYLLCNNKNILTYNFKIRHRRLGLIIKYNTSYHNKG